MVNYCEICRPYLMIYIIFKLTKKKLLLFIPTLKTIFHTTIRTEMFHPKIHDL